MTTSACPPPCWTGSELIFRVPARAQLFSTVVTTTDGVRMRPPVPGHDRDKVFWSTDGPRIEAVFPHP